MGLVGSMDISDELEHLSPAGFKNRMQWCPSQHVRYVFGESPRGWFVECFIKNGKSRRISFPGRYAGVKVACEEAYAHWEDNFADIYISE